MRRSRYRAVSIVLGWTLDLDLVSVLVLLVRGGLCIVVVAVKVQNG